MESFIGQQAVEDALPVQGPVYTKNTKQNTKKEAKNEDLLRY